MLAGLKRFVLWDYPRASWQYDLMCAVILAFIFVTPRRWFLDQPKIPQASQISVLPSEQGTHIFFIEPELIGFIPEKDRLARVSGILEAKYRKAETVTRIEAVFDSDREIKGYMAFAKP